MDDPCNRPLRYGKTTIEEPNACASIEAIVFHLEELTYLGFNLDKDGVRVARTWIAASKSYPTTRNIMHYRKLLGLFEFFRK